MSLHIIRDPRAIRRQRRYSKENGLESVSSCDKKPLERILKMRLTAVFQEVPGGYVGFIEELPGANTQGADLNETRKNLVEAVEMILDANRQLAEEYIAGKKIIREPLLIPTIAFWACLCSLLAP
jgi:predicted RNase H-like HicB family nuclease